MRKKITIVGGGACALMLGCELNTQKFEVTIYEKNAAPGRKFLVAGDGGLNLTHSEEESKFITRYTPSDLLAEAFHHFSNRHLIAWLQKLGIETYTGSSGRVFPLKTIKPITVLNRLLETISNNNVTLHARHEWQGFGNNGAIRFVYNNKPVEIKSDYVIFCLGGASWPVTGSTGNWTEYFLQKKIHIHPFLPSNCAFEVCWPEAILSKAEGKVLKNVTLSCGDHTHAGEVVITKFGLEGSGIYPLSPQIREQLIKQGSAKVVIDLKPMLSESRLFEKLNSKGNLTQRLKTQLNLSDPQMVLLKQLVSKEDFLDPVKLCYHIKHLVITVVATGPIEDAISTVGGIALNEIDRNFQLTKLPHHFAIGEMLDYDAPTGGYLLQSCFSMGKFLADYFNSL